MLAIPAGGVPVAAPMADELRLPLEVAVVGEITSRENPERDYGAVAFDRTVRLNDALLSAYAVSEQEIEAGIEATRAKVQRRLERFSAGARPDLDGATALVVDDGLASGFTLRAAIEAVKRARASRVWVAVPTAHERCVRELLPEVDRMFCPNVRSNRRFTVADAYERWYDVDEDEAAKLLGEAARAR